MNRSDTAYLILENGEVFTGKSFGARREAVGEIVFTTGMTGYIETLTDPSYYGQIIVHTFPLIGNYGMISADFESKSVGASAVIVKDWCREPSNFRCEGNLDNYLKEQNIPGLYGIDTRALTKVLREYGTLRGMITRKLRTADTINWEKHSIHNPVAFVSTKYIYEENAARARYKVALMDFGLKENIKRDLLMRDCDLVVLPFDTGRDEILKINPDGIVLSNGPGDPKENEQVIKNLKHIMETGLPIFGICLGHQLLALANGFQTSKLKYGHRGSNQPVVELRTKRVYISSQNHGYAVENASIDGKLAASIFFNLNDGTCEGLEYKKYPAFSVQFHPEGCAGPQDTQFLFDRFLALMEVRKNAGK